MKVRELIRESIEKYGNKISVKVNDVIQFPNKNFKYFDEIVLGYEFNKDKNTLFIYIGDDNLKLDVNFIMTRSALIALGETKEDVNKKLNKNSIYL